MARQLVPILLTAVTIGGFVTPPAVASAKVTSGHPPRPVITSVTPKRVPQSGGAIVHISGRHLTPLQDVRIVTNADDVSATILHSSAHYITMRVPKLNEGGRHYFVVDTPAGQASRALDVDYVPALKLWSVTPHRADVTGRIAVTLGGRFDGVLKVLFGKKTAIVQRDGPGNKMLVTVPPHRAGTVRVRVVYAFGVIPAASKNADRFTYADNGKPKVQIGTLPSLTIGSAYYGLLRTADGRPGTWRVTSGRLPTGVDIEPGEVEYQHALFGTPSARGSDKITLRFVDRRGRSDTDAIHLRVAAQTWRVDDDSSTYGGALACGGDTCYRSTGAPTVRINTENSSHVWTSTDVPAQEGTGYDGAVINGMACASAETCVAYGQDDTQDEEADYYPALLVGLHGGTWTSFEGDARDFLHDAACGGSSCMVIGSTDDGTDHQVVYQYADGDWTRHSMAPSGGRLRSVTLNDVNCHPDGTCLAVGLGRRVTGGPTVPVVATISPAGEASFRILPMPARASGAATALAIDCRSESSCITLADYGYNPATGTGTTYYDQLAGDSWSAHRFAAPRGAKQSSLRIASVGCNGSSVCYAVGSASVNDRKELVAVRIGTGKPNTFVPRLPEGKSDIGKYQTVSCVKEGACWAGAVYSYTPWNYAAGRYGYGQLAITSLGASAVTSSTQRFPPAPQTRPYAHQFGALACSTSGCIRDDTTQIRS